MLIFHYFFLKKVFPYFVKLKLSGLDFSINSFVQVDPKLFKKLQTISQLHIWSQDHIKNFFVLNRSIHKLLQALTGLPNIFPSCFSAFSANIFIILRILYVLFLLLLVCQINTSKQICVLLVTTIKVGLVHKLWVLLIYLIAWVAIVRIWAEVVFNMIGLFWNPAGIFSKHAIVSRTRISKSIVAGYAIAIACLLVEVFVAKPVVVEAKTPA